MICRDADAMMVTVGQEMPECENARCEIWVPELGEGGESGEEDE